MAETTPKGAASGLSSPKLVRKMALPQTGGCINVAYGCEHLEDFHKSGDKNWKNFENAYIRALQTLHTENTIVSRSFKHGKACSSSIRPTWLCIQCPFVFSDETRKTHFLNGTPAKHPFYVDSRLGAIFCANCDDYVYDPHFERIRAANGTKKRKFDEYITPEDYRTVPPNSTHAPCRAIGLRGLYNMGNTCFMSVVLQSLLHNPLVRSYFLSNGHKPADCETEFCISCALDEIFTEFYSLEKTEGFGAVNMLMNSWKTAEASNSELAGYHQQDAHEYMQFILNSLHTTNGGTGGSDCQCVVHRVFYGITQSIVTCDQCNNKTITREPFLDLSLDVRAQLKSKTNGESKASDSGGIRLEDCLRKYTSKEKLAAAEYTCRKCAGQRDATKQFSLLSTPPVLSIHLKRFSHTKDKSSKVTTPVKFPLVLDMLPYSTIYVTPDSFPKPKANSSVNGVNGSKDTETPTPSKDKSSQDDSKTAPNIVKDYSNLLEQPRDHWSPDYLSYNLSAVIVHKGEINSGHYVNYAREGKDWFLFDDSKVVLASEGEVLAAEAYLLVYVLRDIAPWVES